MSWLHGAAAVGGTAAAAGRHGKRSSGTGCGAAAAFRHGWRRSGEDPVEWLRTGGLHMNVSWRVLFSSKKIWEGHLPVNQRGEKTYFTVFSKDKASLQKMLRFLGPNFPQTAVILEIGKLLEVLSVMIK